MRRETLFVAILLGVVIVPLVAVSIASPGTRFNPVLVTRGPGGLAPMGSLYGPTQVSPPAAGVIAIAAVLALIALLRVVSRIITRGRVRGKRSRDAAASPPPLLSFLEARSRRVLSYRSAPRDYVALWLTVAFACTTLASLVAFVTEGFGTARPQILSLTIATAAFSLAGLTVTAATALLPSILVAEEYPE